MELLKMMSSILVSVIILTITGGVSADTGNCTDDHRAEHIEQCAMELRNLQSEDFGDNKGEDIYRDPMNLVIDDTFCEHSDETQNYLKCVFEAYETCAKNTSMEGYYTSPENAEKAVQSLCEAKAKLEKENGTALVDCVEMKRPGVHDCMATYVVSDQPSSYDICGNSEQFRKCLSEMDECTGDTQMLVHWATLMEPTGCEDGAASLVGLFSTVLLAALVSLLFTC